MTELIGKLVARIEVFESHVHIASSQAVKKEQSVTKSFWCSFRRFDSFDVPKCSSGLGQGDLKKCRKDAGSQGSFHRLEPPVIFFPGETCLTLCTGDA